jgi:hypothetical protein
VGPVHGISRQQARGAVTAAVVAQVPVAQVPVAQAPARLEDGTYDDIFDIFDIVLFRLDQVRALVRSDEPAVPEPARARALGSAQVQGGEEGVREHGDQQAEVREEVPHPREDDSEDALGRFRQHRRRPRGHRAAVRAAAQRGCGRLLDTQGQPRRGAGRQRRQPVRHAVQDFQAEEEPRERRVPVVGCTGAHRALRRRALSRPARRAAGGD